MSNQVKGYLLHIASLVLSIGVPFIATIIQFPLFVQRSSTATVSGLSVLILLICIVPLIKHTNMMIKSASIPFVWTIVAVGLIALHSIVDEMIIVAVLGAISNWIGAFLYKVGTKYIHLDMLGEIDKDKE